MLFLCVHKYYNLLDTKILIESLINQINHLQHALDRLAAENISLNSKLSVLKNKKNSNNSHTPPSKDENRPLRNQSLREKSDKKVGGQPNHEGKTLKCSGVIDEVIEHLPGFCNCCGEDLKNVPEDLIETRQLIDIPVIKPICTEHRIYRKTCSCGHQMESKFPTYVSAKIQYGTNVESLIGYLHTRQYLPYKRMQEFFNDVMNLPVSVGGINNILNRLVLKAKPHYEQIKKRIYQSQFIGTDETGIKVNGENNWMWTWQNEDLTFIVHSDNRGSKTIEDNFSEGLPNAVLQHDRFACHFNCDALHHQICTAHLLRDLKYIVELYSDCAWAVEMKALLINAIQLKKVLTSKDYYGQCKEREILQLQLEQLIVMKIDADHSKAKTLQKSLLKHQQYILYFLYHPKVPPDNNGSERAIRNIKVKQKISGQFKSINGANGFAILRSVVDTSIKSGQNILNALMTVAKLGTE